ncbi:hypothetical protein CASFOL_039169 [Castilleja foliolosa]|uniref:AP2/ERF domain-containing protein n=1 Tax=Castilleja foliolosa TaxID=1961234 RepID=A0ABD3BH94_9LAMI
MACYSFVQAMKPEETGGGEISEAVRPQPPPPPDGDQIVRGFKKAKKERGCTAKERISKMPPSIVGKRSSIYRGVTRHRWTGRYEAHLWDKSTWNQNQNKKGKQVYLGAYDDEEAAARAYDLAALKYWGPGTLINFPVTDYTRDLEEMQNVSREDYLASLRRKSSGFSRGIAKYRPLSSRWDLQAGRAPSTDHIYSEFYGDEMATGSEYAGGYSVERKIDLSNHIKWWSTNKSSQTDFRSRVLDETNIGCSDAVASELKDLEWSTKPTEPYEMPRLGVPPERMKPKKISAMSTLLNSTAYKSLQEKVSKRNGKAENDENENKNSIEKVELGKAVDKTCHNVEFGSSGGLSIHKNVYPLTSLLSAPLLTNYNSIDQLADSVLWSNLVPVLQTGSSHTNEVTKNEPSSDYTFYQQGD